MKTTCRVLLGGFASALAASLGWGAEATARPAGGATTSLESIVGRPDDPIGSAATEIQQLQEQLKNLLPLRAQLVLKREADQSGLSAGEAGSDAAAQHQARIDAMNTAIGVFDEQIKLIQERIKFLQTRVTPPAAAAQPGPVGLSSGVTPPVKPVPRVAPEKIKSAAGALAQTPAMDVAAARKAATGILATSQPGATELEIDQVAVLVLQQASKDADADLRAVLAEAKRENVRKKALRGAVDAAQDKKDSSSDLFAEISQRISLFQDRYAKAERALAELRKKISDTTSGIISNQK